MGRSGLSAWIPRLFAIALGAAAPAPALATATAIAPGVALNAVASCTRGDLDLTLTAAAAANEAWLATTATGSIGGGQQGTSLSNVPPPAPPYLFQVPFFSGQPADTLVGSYVWIGTGPADPGNTAEFFVYYNCTTRQVLLSCFGAYGTCPQTAQQAAALLAPRIPTLSAWAMLLTVLVVAGAGGLALRRRA